MTTTELIRILQKNEFGGATGRPRTINFKTEQGFLPEPDIVVDSISDGLFTDITLKLIITHDSLFTDYNLKPIGKYELFVEDGDKDE